MAGKLVLKPNEERRIKRGHLWIYADEVASLDLEAAGALVEVIDSRGHSMGTAYANPESRIVARMLSKKALPELKAAWWKDRLQFALKQREWLFDSPHYRWIHGEGDKLPGLIIDRFGDDVVLQAHTAGIEYQLETIIQVVDELVSPANIYLHNQIGARSLEGLTQYNRVVKGSGDGLLTADEHGMPMLCHAIDGQKTGYFYDQRPNRAWIGSIAHGKRVLDLFSYVGAFAVNALRGGASEVVSIDASQDALTYAGKNVQANGFGDRWQGICADVMDHLVEMDKAKERFDIVICDPPAFVKNRKKLQEGLRGYERVTTRSAKLVKAGGILCVASCSRLVSAEDLRKSVFDGVRGAGRAGQVIYEGGAGADHPWLPSMPETRYLKFIGMFLD